MFLVSVDATIAVAAFPALRRLQVVGGAAIGLLLVGRAGAAVAGLPPARFAN